jgi:hypothetical protein
MNVEGLSLPPADTSLVHRPDATIIALLMSRALSEAIEGLASYEPSTRASAAAQIYRIGRAPADRAAAAWLRSPALLALLGPEPFITVGVAVERSTFARIREANGSPRLQVVPTEQDAEEFELHFPPQISLDVLTTREPGGSGAIARSLARFGEGVQQVEVRCAEVDRATAILREDFGVAAIYPQARPGAGGTRVNFFLVPAAEGGKVLVEMYEPAKSPDP